MGSTAHQRMHILRHALGVRHPRAVPYRNHFVTGPGSDDYEACEELVQAGLMIRRDASELSGNDPVYVVTDAGKELALKDQAT
jgi:hypothetical protein